MYAYAMGCKSQERGVTLAPELVPVYEHAGVLRGIPLLQKVLELLAGGRDVVHHALQHQVVVLCNCLHDGSEEL